MYGGWGFAVRAHFLGGTGVTAIGLSAAELWLVGSFRFLGPLPGLPCDQQAALLEKRAYRKMECMCVVGNGHTQFVVFMAPL